MVVVSSNFTAPVEGILFQAPSTKLILDDQEIGTATLYIRKSDIIWGGGVRPTGGPAPALNILYPNIAIHAIQRDPTAALYVVVNYDIKSFLKSDNGQGPTPQPVDREEGEFDISDEDADDEDPITQLRFVPENEEDLQAMYASMSEGQALNPDPADEVEDEDFFMGEDIYDGQDDLFEDAEESDPSPEEAAARLDHLHLGNGHGQGHDAPGGASNGDADAPEQ